jgi:hypothetical protein
MKKIATLAFMMAVCATSALSRPVAPESLPTGVTINGQAHYAYGQTRLPDLPFSYDPKAVSFDRASVPMIEAVVGPGTWGFLGSDGKEYERPLNLATVPFWQYASYVDTASKNRCRYNLIDGFLPAPYDKIPLAEAIKGVEEEASTAVIRNCGRGFEVVSREVYGSVFDNDYDFMSPYLAEYNLTSEPVGKAVPDGLAKDYVTRLIHAFGSRQTLQSQLNRVGKHGDFLDRLKAALLAEGLTIPTR